MARKKIHYKNYPAEYVLREAPSQNEGESKEEQPWLAVVGLVLTSDKEDRDGDVLDPRGATADPNSPLLWQHDMEQPLGRLLGITDKTDHSISGDVGLRNSAKGLEVLDMLRLKMLRVSIGFVPKKMEPRRTEGRVTGQNITEYEIVEVSLVTVPSNTDAVITYINQLGREGNAEDKAKFLTLFSKHWARPIGKKKKMSKKSIGRLLRNLDLALGIKADGDGQQRPQNDGNQGGQPKPRNDDNGRDGQQKPRNDDDNGGDNKPSPMKQLKQAIDIIEQLKKVDFSNVEAESMVKVFEKLANLLRSVMDGLDQGKDENNQSNQDADPETNTDLDNMETSGGKNYRYLWNRFMGRS